MPYITLPASTRHHQITIDEILNAPVGYVPRGTSGKPGDTRTIYLENVPARLQRNQIMIDCVNAINAFIARNKDLYEVNRRELYHSFKIPKRSGGWRQIDAPLPPLMNALRELKEIFERQFFAEHHTSAFAYVEKRCAVDAVKRHQSNKSRWFLKLDFSNFFGSTTEEFVIQQLGEIWPFSELKKNSTTWFNFCHALDLAFLDGVLPQGTPLSPMLTNLIMIPLDHYFMNGLYNFNGTRFIYTRYADDIDISCRYDFKPYEIIDFMRSGIKKFNAPYEIKKEKTHYGSCSGRNWILGVMYNKDCKITIGHKAKDAFRAQLSDYLRAKNSGSPWSLPEVQQLSGLLSYYRKIEPAYFDALLEKYSNKFGFNVLTTIRQDLKTL